MRDYVEGKIDLRNADIDFGDSRRLQCFLCFGRKCNNIVLINASPSSAAEIIAQHESGWRYDGAKWYCADCARGYIATRLQ